MPVTNTDELATLVQDWLNRDDLTDIIPTFIEAADSRILADPRSRGEMTQQVIVKDRTDPQNQVNPVPIDTVYVPTWFDFYSEDLDPTNDAQPAEPARDEDTYDYEYLNVYVDDIEHTRVSINEFYSNNHKNQQYTYTEIGGRLYIKGWPDFDPTDPSTEQEGQEPYSLRLVVYKKEPLTFPEVEDADAGTQVDDTALSGTSELLRSIPMAYLYGSLVEAAMYLRDMEGLTMYQARYEEFMDKLYKDYKRKQISAGAKVGSVGGDYGYYTERHVQ